MVDMHGNDMATQHTIWGVAGVLVGFILKSNGWIAAGDAPFWKRIAWAQIGGDVSAGIAIFFIALTICSLFTLEPVTASGIAIGLTVFGLKPTADMVRLWVEALIARIRGGANGAP